MNIIFSLFKTLLKITGLCIVLLALFLNGARFIIKLIPDKSELVAAVATEWLHQPVQIQQVQLAGSASHPQVILTHVILKNLKLDQLVVSLNFWRSILNWTWITDYLVVDGLSLSNQTAQKSSDPHTTEFNWILSQPYILFKNVDLAWQVNKSSLLQINDFNFLIENHDDQHVISGQFELHHALPTALHFVYEMRAKNITDPKMRGVLYASGKNVRLPEWFSFLPDAVKPKGLALLSGNAQGELWAHVVNRHWQSVQLKGQVNALAGQLHQTQWSITPLHFNSIVYLQDHLLGAFAFEGNDMQLFLSSLFSHQLLHLKSSGQINWFYKDAHWLFHVSQFHLADSHFQLASRAQLSVGAGEKPRIDLLGDISLDDMKQLSTYLPDHLLHPKLVKWLDGSLVQGQLTNGKFLLQGPLTAFPFDQHNGHFQVSARLSQVALKYLPGWPVLSNLSGNLRFDDRGMRITAKNAMIMNNPVQKITANIESLSHANLIVQVESKTDLAKGLALLKHTPLPVAKNLDRVQGAGTIQNNLTLNIPLFPGHGEPVVQGNIAFLDNQLTFKKWDVSLTDLFGQLHFENQMLSGTNLKAMLFGQSLKLNLQTKQSNLQVDVDGPVDLQSLSKRLPAQLVKNVNGRAMVHAQLILHSVGSPLQNTLTVFSNLNGIAINDVPPPFAKLAQQSWPTRLSLAIQRDGLINASLIVGDVLSGRFRFALLPSGLKFDLGGILIGPGMAVLPNTPGLFVKGYLSTVDLNVWKLWLERIQTGNQNLSGSQNTFPSFLKNINLTIGNLIAAGQNWKDLLFNISPDPKGIFVQLQNDQVSGKILLPKDKKQPVNARFDYLFLQAQQSDKNNTLDPQTIPPIDLKIDDFRLKNALDGAITLQTMPTNHGLLIQNLQAKSSLFTLNVKGRWTVYDTHAQTELAGKFHSEDLGAFLLSRHLSSRLKGGILSTSFDLKWLGAPSQFQLNNAQGKLSFHLQEGRILQFNTETESNLELGRLLNLLSLESVSHLLTFDFSSLTKKGFPFHTVEGAFDIRQGDIFTNNVDIDGPLANVQVSGTIGFARQDNNLLLSVTPYVSSSLPVIVGLAGGPIAGITAWIANKILEPSVGHLMRMTYQVTGSWDKPIVKKLSS